MGERRASDRESWRERRGRAGGEKRREMGLLAFILSGLVVE